MSALKKRLEAPLSLPELVLSMDAQLAEPEGEPVEVLVPARDWSLLVRLAKDELLRQWRGAGL